MNQKAIKEAIKAVEAVAKQHDMTKAQLEHELVRYIRSSGKVARKGGKHCPR